MSKIFVVEDDALTVAQLQKYLAEMGHECVGAVDNGEAALVQIAKTNPDLVLMDIHLCGEMDGIEVATCLQGDSAPAVIFLTAYADDEIVARAKLTAPFGYLIKPFSRKELKTGIEMGLYKCEMEHKQQRIYDGVLHMLTELVKLHNPFLNDLQHRAAVLADALARELNLPIQEIKGIRLAAMLHGIGMISLPAQYFQRCTPLHDLEKAYFQTHPAIAAQLLANIEFPQPVSEMVHQHMERLDGSGFPRGLKGDEILPGARIVAVACVVAKLLTPHGIEPATDLDEALTELEAGSGTLFDSEVVAACVRLFKEKNFAFHDYKP